MIESKRVALVTGAGSGVGRHSSLALLEAGYHLVLVGRREDALEETKTLAGVNASKCLIVSCDVSDPKSIKSLFTVTKEQFGRLDLLFNNAGIGAPAIPLEDLTVEQWKSVVDINLTGGFSLHPGSFQNYERTESSGRTDYQQRLHFRACAKALFITLHCDQTCHNRTYAFFITGRQSI